MSNTAIRLKKSGVTGNTPTGLANGELALNFADGKLYYKNSLGGTSYISNQFSFDTINANSSLILATSVSDTLSFAAGNNVTITSNTSTKTITINASVSGGSDPGPAFSQANAAFAQANAAFVAANTGGGGTSSPVAIYSDRFIANGATTTFNLSVVPASENYIIAVVDGITQLKDTYTVSGNIVTFDTTFENGANVEVTTITGGGALDPYASNTANAAFVQANSSFDAANSASLYANAAFVAANSGSSSSFAFNQANAAFDASNSVSSYANSSFGVANSASLYANGAFVAANTADGKATSAGLYANGAFLQSNSAFGTANSSSNYANSAFATANTADGKATSAGLYANGAFAAANLKFNSSGGTISGDVNVTGNLTVQGNTFSVNSTQLVANDTLFIMGIGNYTSDILDIGFSAHYNNGVNAHTGLIRDAGSKEWQLFEEYDPDISSNNNIDINHASFKIATLNANVKSTTITIKGIDLLPHVNLAYGTANSASVYANGAFLQSNSAFGASNSVSSYANSAFATANTADGKATSAGLYANGAFGSSNSASSYANGSFTQANAAFGVANSASLYANGAFSAVNSASSYANSAFTKANNAFNKANNALANTSGTTFDGDLLIGSSGKLTVLAVGGDEGGEILLGKAVTNTTLNGTGVTIDVWQNRLRFFEQGGSARGAYIDLTAASAGVGSDLLSGGGGTTDTTARASAAAAFDTANSASLYANGAFTAANTANGKSTSAGLYANGAFIQANAVFNQSNNFVWPQANAAFNASNSVSSYANSAFAAANTADGKATSAGLYANGAFGSSNSASSYANAAFAQANAAFAQANTGGGGGTTDTYARDTANAAFIQANSAFAQANTGGTSLSKAIAMSIVFGF